MAVQPPLIPGVIEPRKKGDTSDFEWQVTIQTTAGSEFTVPFDLTGTTSHRFQVRSKTGALIFDLGAAVVTAAAGTMRATPQLTDVDDATGEPFWAQHKFIDAAGKIRKVPGYGFWECRIIEDFST